MKGLNQIEREANTLITATLQEQNSVFIPSIGRFEPVFHPEYILLEESADETSRKLIPPHISLSFVPSDYLLQRSHYTTVDFTPPIEYIEPAFSSNLSTLHNLDETEVATTLTQHIKKVLTDLFRGRRTTLLEIGDLYITEEGEDNLLINFVASEEMLQSLNFVFSAYKPIELSPTVSYPDTEIKTELHSNGVIQISIPKEKKVIPTPLEELPIVEESEESEEPTALPEIEIEPDEEGTNPPTEEVPPTIEKEKESKGNGTTLFILALCLLSFALIIYTRRGKTAKVDDTINSVAQKEEVLPEPKVEIKEVAPAPLDTITVERGVTLAKLSRAYYNDNSYFWVYIYFANYQKINDPNNLEIGQELIIPSLEVFDILSNPEEAIREAKEWGAFIQVTPFTSYEKQRPSLPMNRSQGS